MPNLYDRTLSRRSAAEFQQRQEELRAFSYQPCWMHNLSQNATATRYPKTHRASILYLRLRNSAQELDKLGQELNENLELRSVSKWKQLLSAVKKIQEEYERTFDDATMEITKDKSAIEAVIEQSLAVKDPIEHAQHAEIRERLREMEFSEVIMMAHRDPGVAKALIASPSKCLLPSKLTDDQLQEIKDSYLKETNAPAMITLDHLQQERDFVEGLERHSLDVLQELAVEAEQMTRPPAKVPVRDKHTGQITQVAVAG